MAKTIFFHLRLLCTRNLANAILALALLPFVSAAQDSTTERSLARPVSSLVFSSTAYFLQGTNLLLRGESPIFADAQNTGETHGALQVNLLEKVQLDITNEGIIARAYGNLEPLVMWGIKLRLFESESSGTGVAAMIRSSVSGGKADSWPNSMSSIASSLAEKGLERYSCEYRIAYAAILVSQEFNESISLHGGLEAQQIHIYNARLDFLPPTTGRDTYVVRVIMRQLGFNGFLGVVVNATQHVAVLGELQSLPELAPSDDLAAINVHRAYRGAVAIQYRVKQSLAVFMNAAHVFLPVGHSFTEVRLGAEATVSLQ
jgi:hypothetical protein